MTTLPDSFFFWPQERYGDSISQAARELGARLQNSALAPWLVSPGGNLAEYMAAVCRDWGVNPWWLMVSAQREQSALTKPDLTAAATAAWLGYVAQDVGRTAKPGYYGIYTQVYRCASQTSWYMGQRADPRVKAPPRWKPGVVLRGEYQVEFDGVKRDYEPKCLAEHVELLYTPHYSILPKNFGYAQEICPEQIRG